MKTPKVLDNKKNEVVDELKAERSEGRFCCADSIRLNTKEPSLHAITIIQSILIALICKKL